MLVAAIPLAGAMMAMRLGITPTFHLSCRLRLLRLESLRQSAVSQLGNAPPWSPRPGLWRRSVAAIASDDKGSPPPQKQRYDLSSGFLRPRESRNLDEEEAAVDRFRDSKPSPDDDDSDEDWRQPRGLQDARGSREFGSRRDEEDLDDEVGDWMGTAEPSKNFRSSSLYTDARSARYSPLPPASSKPKRARNPNPRKQAMQETVPSSPPPRDDDATFVPPVIKPEQPYIYSYSETPKVAPVGFREPVYSPFGPEGVSRPWTGRPPLAKSKKAPREFDSFNPPPQGKKGVKPVQQPGPFPEGQEPALGRSREEIMGAPLTDAEVKELVARAQKEDRQLNLGRDGLTHNMLDLIHQHWKRRRVCKIKCKGVPTVDMDNVCNVLEEKSGGKIILRAGGVVYLFRGRNYNYKTRPIIPLMLWKPPAPIYPKLVEKAPAGLTVEEANELRKLGRKLAPICHLGKNGVYLSLVRDVKNAFRADDLVKVDCKRMNPSDYKKIGAKLKDLVPCVLLSFEHESILMWKGPKSQADKPDGVDQDNSGEEAVTPFRQELPEDGKELLEQTLSQDDSEILAAEEDIDQYDDDTDAESDHDIESAYQSEDEESQEEEVDTEAESSYNDRDEAEAAAERAESSYNNSDEGEAEAEAAAERAGFSYEVRDEAEAEAEGDKAAAERAERAIAEFESRWQEALSSSEALVLEEQQVEDPDAVFEVVKSQFGGPYGAPAKPRNKRNSNELVGKKALRNSAPRLDSSVLDRVPKDPSGLLEIDELAKLLAP